jgi:kinesin family member 1
MQDDLELPRNGTASGYEGNDTNTPKLVAQVRFVPKNPTLIHRGFLMMPDISNTKWERRYVELRRPYLHVYSTPEGDEFHAINLSNSRIDHQPQLVKLLRRPSNNVFAIFAPHNTYLFAAREEKEKITWILKIDQGYFSSGSNSPDYEL